MSLHDLIGKIDAVDAIELTTRALDLIGSISKSATVGTAADVVRLIGNIYTAVVDSAAQKITAEEAHKALDQLEEAIRLHDSATDAEIDKKFDDTDKE